MSSPVLVGLRRLRTASYGLTLITAAACLVVLSEVDQSADAVAAQSAPAILKVDETRVALLRAHGAALRSFTGDALVVGGPGEDYQTQVTIAGQSLTQVAEANAAGEPASRDIEVIGALLATYTSLIGRANGHYHQGPASQSLVLLRLQDASVTLDGILARLEGLRLKQLGALQADTGSGWAGLPAALAWMAPLGALIITLIATQVFVARRFRRRINIWLVLATSAVVLTAAMTSLSLVSAAQLRQAESGFGVYAGQQEARICALAHSNAVELAGLVGRERPAPCPVAAAADTDHIKDSAFRASERANVAADSRWMEVLLPVCAGATLLMIWLGLRRRLEEYRYQP